MITKIINGKEIANHILEDLTTRVASHRTKPTLAVLLVGDDPASHIYVARKEKAADRVGINSEIYEFNEDVSEETLLSHIAYLNYSEETDGILVQLPLPKHIDTQKVINAIDPTKDVDGFHPLNVGRLTSGDWAYAPCTPNAVMKLLAASETPLSGAMAVMVGCSALVGRPTALMLNKKDATVIIANKKTKNLPEICRQGDIIVVAAGCPNLIRAECLKPGVTIIDVGINRLPDGKIVGDVAYEECLGIAGAMTPVPGGVGPMTISCLLENTINFAWRRTARKILESV